MKHKTLSCFDLDDTLVIHDPLHAPHIKIVNLSGKFRGILSIHDFNNHVLPPAYDYDFSEFWSSKKFIRSAIAVRPMIQRLQNHAKRNHTVIITARGDMDDKQVFAQHLHRLGIDARKIRVYQMGKTPKSHCVRNLIAKHGFTTVNFFDDAIQNLQDIAKLSQRLHGVRFNLFHVFRGKIKRLRIADALAARL